MKPILFNTEMVKALLDGRKTTTRRIIKLPKHVKIQGNGLYILFADGAVYEDQHFEEIVDYIRPPYQLGDVLYVRETFAIGKIAYGEEPDGTAVPYISQCTGENDIIPKEYALRNKIGTDDVIWKPSIFMPKEAARIFLRVTDVKAERLKDISEDGTKAEGCKKRTGCDRPCEECLQTGEECAKRLSARKAFSQLWDTTVKKSDRDKYGWDANPWVWAIEFERCDKP